MERISVDDGGAQFFFLCECKKQYEDIRMFQSHVTKSGHCGGTFNTKVLERHKRLKAEEFEFVCECSKRFSHEREFESHVTRFSHCGGLFNRTVRERYRRPVFKNATFPNQDCSCTNDEEFSYTCECSQVFYDWKLFRNHVTKTRHCGGLFNSEVLGRCRKLKVTKATPFTQTSKQPIGVDYEFVCTCSERFADQVRLERHIKKSGHFEGMFDYDVYNYCRKPVGHLAVRKHDNVIEDSTTRTLPARSSAPINPTANIKVDGAARPSTMQKLSDFISGSEVIRVSGGNVMADGEHMLEFKECSLIGTLIESSKMKRKRNEDVSSRGFEDQKSDQQRVFLNTHEPFCLVTVGVQGGGKSHTLATVLEGCLIPFPENSLCRLEEPMTTLVLHFDDCPYIRCEVGTFSM